MILGIEKFFERGKGSLRGLHPDFRLRQGDNYIHNESRDTLERPITCKVGFKFDDLSLLDDCPFTAKFGINLSGGPKYFGLAYDEPAHDKQELLKWAERFPYVRLMEPLNRYGELTQRTKTTAIKG
jgi:hypothetical protein